MHRTLLLVLALAGPAGLLAQRSAPEPDSLALPAGLTQMVPFGHQETVLFNTLATYQATLPAGSAFDLGRGNTLESILQTQVGLSRRNRFSLGLDLYWSHYRFGPDETTGSFAALGDAPTDGFAAHAISQFGLKARLAPIASLPQLTTQVRVLFPTISSDKIERLLLGHDRTSSQLQISYLQLVAPRLYAYAQVEWGVQFKNENRKQTTWNLPVQLFALYRLWRQQDRSVVAFAGAGHTSYFEQQFKGGLKEVDYARVWALGGQWQISRPFGLSLAYQGSLGFRDASIVKGSFHGISLNLRYVGLVFR
jgi:hypothetical protein